jgi:hypothetical protein
MAGLLVLGSNNLTLIYSSIHSGDASREKASDLVGALGGVRPVQHTSLWQGWKPPNPKPIIFPKIIGFTGKPPVQGVSGNGFTGLVPLFSAVFFPLSGLTECWGGG